MRSTLPLDLANNNDTSHDRPRAKDIEEHGSHVSRRVDALESIIASAVGIVTDLEGRPIDNAQVLIVPNVDALFFRSYTDAEGRFPLPEEPDSQYRFLVSKPGFFSLDQRYRLDLRERTPLVLKLEADAVLVGQLLLDSGDACPGWNIRACGPTDLSSCSTDNQGFFALRLGRRRFADLVACPSGRPRESTIFRSLSSVDGPHRIIVPSQIPPGTIRGVVRDQNLPSTEVFVTINSSTLFLLHEQLDIDEQGNFRIGPIAPGNYDLDFSRKSTAGGSRIVRNISVAPGAISEVGVIDLHRAPEITITISGATQSSLDGARVSLYDFRGKYLGGAREDAPSARWITAQPPDRPLFVGLRSENYGLQMLMLEDEMIAGAEIRIHVERGRCVELALPERCIAESGWSAILHVEEAKRGLVYRGEIPLWTDARDGKRLRFGLAVGRYTLRLDTTHGLSGQTEVSIQEADLENLLHLPMDMR